MRAPRHRCLLAQRRELPADFPGQVAEPLEVGLHRLQLADGLLLAPPVFEDAGGFFDEAPAVLGSGVQDPVQLSLPHDDVHFAAEPGVGEEFLDVQEPAR